MTSIHEIYGRRGRIITDSDAQDITRVEELSYDLKVKDVAPNTLYVATPDMTISDFTELLRKWRISGAPVVEDGKLIGIISIEDLIRALCAGDANATVEKYMTRQVITVNAYDPVVKAMETFAETRLGRFPVVDENGVLVGMITKGDLTRGVLLALQRDYQEEEIRRYRASHLFEDIVSDRTSLILRYSIKPRDFTHGGEASSRIKRALMRLGATPKIARLCGIAIYEAEMNLIIHTNNGGTIRVEIEPHQIMMRAYDDGPGIQDVERALQAGYSTATEEVREMGFGAGMGLVNIRRCVDKMELESSPNKGTKLDMRIFLRERESFRETGYFEEEKKQNDS